MKKFASNFLVFSAFSSIPFRQTTSLPFSFWTKNIKKKRKSGLFRQKQAPFIKKGARMLPNMPMAFGILDSGSILAKYQKIFCDF
ncbi:MAG: hypothetical protein IJD59_06590 [Clostridia bacterium]|nr:hypothetical protein [Clostridia bacterium]